MTTFLRPTIAALTIVLLAGTPGAAQQPPPDISGEQANPAQCSLPLQLSARAFLVKLRLELQPSESQRPAFDEFDTAFNKAVESVVAICRSGTLPAPAERLQSALKQIAESLRAIEALQPAASALYGMLTDKQKSRLGSFDRWFDAAASLLSEWALNSKLPNRSEDEPGAGKPKENQLRLCMEGHCYDVPNPNSDGAREYRWRDQENLGRLWHE